MFPSSPAVTGHCDIADFAPPCLVPPPLFSVSRCWAAVSSARSFKCAVAFLWALRLFQAFTNHKTFKKGPILQPPTQTLTSGFPLNGGFTSRLYVWLRWSLRGRQTPGRARTLPSDSLSPPLCRTASRPYDDASSEPDREVWLLAELEELSVSSHHYSLLVHYSW